MPHAARRAARGPGSAPARRAFAAARRGIGGAQILDRNSVWRMGRLEAVAAGDVLQVLDEEAVTAEHRAAVAVPVVDAREPDSEAARRQLVEHPVGGIFEKLILLGAGR